MKTVWICIGAGTLLNGIPLAVFNNKKAANKFVAESLTSIRIYSMIIKG